MPVSNKTQINPHEAPKARGFQNSKATESEVSAELQVLDALQPHAHGEPVLAGICFLG